MIQSVWKNLTGLQKAAEHLWCDFKWAKNSSPVNSGLVSRRDLLKKHKKILLFRTFWLEVYLNRLLMWQ